ncbi:MULTISPECIES: ParB/RepB/Spo0J family partition protein [unclassified Undibacterium]|uniref:ParB/RepB/Spo0J family partition protein n=1 Tax=unclassified Undibacterium TaxID=2630295 RepID=UPI003C2D9C27
MNNKTGAQKKQIKFSGLVSTGAIPALDTASDKNFIATVSAEDNPLPLVTEAHHAATPEPAQSTRRRIRLDQIDDSPYQPRMVYSAEEIDNLAHSFAAAGQEEVITVREKPSGRFELIKGHRRTRAARSIGWTEIDADVVIKDDRAAKLSAMVSNEGSVTLTDYERAKMYQETLADRYASTQQEVANIFSTSQALVSMRMNMLKLPQNILDMLNHNPELFNASCGQTIAALLKAYPEEGALIESAVMRLQDGASQNSIKPWVEQMLKAKSKAIAKNDQAVITDRSGRPIFTTKTTGKEIAIRIKATEISAEEIEELILKALRSRAEENIKVL